MKVRNIETNDYLRIVDIYNYYIENSNAAFPEENVDVKFVESLRQSVLADSFLALDNGEAVVGFGFLRKFLPIENFNRTALISYFISPEYTRRGLGSLLMNELTDYANDRNIDNFIAVIASDNIQSINFHKKQGFQLCGTLNNVGVKKGRDLSIIYMRKSVR